MARVLLVEAEPSLARRMTWILETEGFETTVAASPDQVLQLADRGYDAVIVNSDDAPTKRDLIGRIRETAPEAGIVDVHSAASAPLRHRELSGADEVIHMPFDAATLLETLTDVIERHHGTETGP